MSNKRSLPPPTLPFSQRRTEGLFGYWDRWSDNDLMMPKTEGSDGNNVITNRDHENVFKHFGLYWRIQSQRESVLTRPIGRNFSWIHLTYNLREFYPIFGLPPMPPKANFTGKGGGSRGAERLLQVQRPSFWTRDNVDITVNN